jgi:8-oxo-dGTP diphosphatase
MSTIPFHYTQPVPAVGVMIFKEKHVLIGKRTSAHGTGEYAFTGGKIDYGETIIDCAKRETWEEAGIRITNVRLLCLTTVLAYTPKHFIDIGVVADWESGEPHVREPDKIESWTWGDVHNLPQPLFAMIPNYLEALRTGKTLFEA